MPLRRFRFDARHRLHIFAATITTLIRRHCFLSPPPPLIIFLRFSLRFAFSPPMIRCHFCWPPLSFRHAGYDFRCAFRDIFATITLFDTPVSAFFHTLIYFTLPPPIFSEAAAYACCRLPITPCCDFFAAIATFAPPRRLRRHFRCHAV